MRFQNISKLLLEIFTSSKLLYWSISRSGSSYSDSEVLNTAWNVLLRASIRIYRTTEAPNMIYACTCWKSMSFVAARVKVLHVLPRKRGCKPHRFTCTTEKLRYVFVFCTDFTRCDQILSQFIYFVLKTLWKELLFRRLPLLANFATLILVPVPVYDTRKDLLFISCAVQRLCSVQRYNFERLLNVATQVYL